MEVHAHSHSERKKFTHYLWEFLMLFLAVFLGFLAENQREHIVEHKRAKQYALNLYKDLQRDTADIIRAGHYEQKTMEMIDSLVLYASSTITPKKNGLLFYYMRLASNVYTVDFNTATMNQLINSGNLRYFTDHDLVTLISTYNTTSSQIIKTLENNIEASRSRAFAIRDQIVKAKYALQYGSVNMDMIINSTDRAFIDSVRNADFPLQNSNPDLLNSYANALIATTGVRRLLNKRYYPKAIKEATDIMVILKKEYHLK